MHHLHHFSHPISCLVRNDFWFRVSISIPTLPLHASPSITFFHVTVSNVANHKDMMHYLRSSLIYFVCIWVAPPRLGDVTRLSRGGATPMPSKWIKFDLVLPTEFEVNIVAWFSVVNSGFIPIDSLNPHQSRLTISLVWRMDSQGNVKPDSEWIGRGIIKPCVRLSYYQAQVC